MKKEEDIQYGHPSKYLPTGCVVVRFEQLVRSPKMTELSSAVVRLESAMRFKHVLFRNSRQLVLL